MYRDLSHHCQILVDLISVVCCCSTKLDLRFSLALCDKEKQFRQTRRERVMLGIKKLLDMEKPRFLPSSPEEVGTAQHSFNIDLTWQQ